MPHNLLQKLLEKRHIKDISELSQDEAEQFDKWEAILSEGEITVDKIKRFCEVQLGVIETQLKSFDNTPQKNERLIIYFNIYKTLSNLINSPMAEREILEKYLLQLINK